MMAAIVISMITALAAPTAISLRVKVYLVHEGRRQLGRRAGAAVGQRHDEVVGLDRQVREHDEGATGTPAAAAG